MDKGGSHQPVISDNAGQKPERLVDRRLGSAWRLGESVVVEDEITSQPASQPRNIKGGTRSCWRIG
jgi:hypothetical protein